MLIRETPETSAAKRARTRIGVISSPAYSHQWAGFRLAASQFGIARPDAPPSVCGSPPLTEARPWRTSYSPSRGPLGNLAGRLWRKSTRRGHQWLPGPSEAHRIGALLKGVAGCEFDIVAAW